MVLKRVIGRPDERRIEVGLDKTRRGFVERLVGVFGPVDITEATWDDLEERLILSDVGATASAELIRRLRAAASKAGVRRASELPGVLHAVMVNSLDVAPGEAMDVDGGERVTKERSAGSTATAPDVCPPQPWVILVVGVNGSGKTTTAAKLAAMHRQAGRTVLVVVADTFRAAAGEQMAIWGERLDVPVMAGQPGQDPGAVVYDALGSKIGRAADAVIIDTAGRLHTQRNLMLELEKVCRVAGRVVPQAPHETLLVLDATTGQNGLSQAKAFAETVAVTGLVLAKLDSSAKGGVAFAVVEELGVPIRYVGTGERSEDLAVFEPRAYVASLLGAGYTAAAALTEPSAPKTRPAPTD